MAKTSASWRGQKGAKLLFLGQKRLEMFTFATNINCPVSFLLLSEKKSEKFAFNYTPLGEKKIVKC